MSVEETKAAYFLVKEIEEIRMYKVYHVVEIEQTTVERLGYNVLSAVPDM